MVKHVLMWRIKEAAEGRSKEENVAICTNAVNGLRDRIDLIRGLEVGRNFAQVASAYDLVITVEFDSREDFAKYLDHPAHKHVGEVVSPLRSDSAVVDYEA